MSSKLSTKSRVIAETRINNSTFSFETGWVAKQADGAVVVRAGETMVLVTVCRAQPRQEQDFFPLVVEYQEKAYAAGKIPGGFFRREGKPAETEILSARLIDRPIRPLFPEGYKDEVQVICTVLSADGQNSPGILAICGAGAALHLSSIPFHGPIAAVRVGRVRGKHIANPTRDELKESDMDFVVAGSKDAIVMVEGGAKFVPEAEVLEALFFGHEELKKIIALGEELRSKVGKEKIVFENVQENPELVAKVNSLAVSDIAAALRKTVKAERRDGLKAVQAKVELSILPTLPEAEQPKMKKKIGVLVHDLISEAARMQIIKEKKRIDGRGLADVRAIECELGLIPRAHGSALFTRGETQAVVTTTLGTSMDAQRIDDLSGQSEKSFMLHYNFPPYSTGEVKMMRGTGRREIGHGALAERALRQVLPDDAAFPYVIRIVSDITESNGSSSMASVCGGSLSMMQAGVPIKEAVAGVAMGLIKEGDEVAVLTDILGDEDHFGDMDFKVCGTRTGVTALQMDIKCRGLSRETMGQALNQARDARLHILGVMEETIKKPSEKLSTYAPVITSMKINPDKIRDVIGPGGKMIRSITERTGVKIDIEDDGTVRIASADGEAAERAKEIIKGLTEEAEIGRIYEGVVKRTTDFGAFVEILPGTEGLVHISQLAHGRVEHVMDVVKEGDVVSVRVLDIDRQGRIRLSRKDALPEQPRGSREDRDSQ